MRGRPRREDICTLIAESYSRNQHNTGKQLSSNLKKKGAKKKFFFSNTHVTAALRPEEKIKLTYASGQYFSHSVFKYFQLLKRNQLTSSS